jgi:hypothetical protein
MIRRDTIDAGDRPAWLLITQVQHARIAADLAGAWNLDDMPDAVRPELLWAVTHHDDGWAGWDEQPGLDADGRPLSFLEMPVDQAISIWTRSIELAAAHSSLAGHLVAEHFLHLRAAATSADHPAAREFAATFQTLSGAWVLDARNQIGAGLSSAVAGRAKKYLQLFDVLSLTLCCGRVPRLSETVLPGGDPLSCQRQSEWHWRFTPWRIVRPSLCLNLEAGQVRARRFRDAQELKQAVEPRHLKWTLTGN